MCACLIIDNALIKSGLIKIAAVAKTLTEVPVGTPSGVLRLYDCLSVVFEVKAVIFITILLKCSKTEYFKLTFQRPSFCPNLMFILRFRPTDPWSGLWTPSGVVGL